MPKVLITPELFLHQETPFVATLKRAGFEVGYPRNPQFARGLGTDEQTIEEVKGAAAVLAGGECLTAGVLAASPDLRVIARCGVGYDRVDIPAATEHKIPVTITPTANHEAVAEQAFALLFGVAKNVVRNHGDVCAGRWMRGMTSPIRGMTLGIIGLGRIGRSTAVRGRALGMDVIATETFPNREFVEEHRIELVELDTLLSRSDYVSLHCPLNDETRGIMNAATFGLMKPGSVLINTSRGGLVVEKDLVSALRSEHLGGAGLDVFEEEPAKQDHPLFEFDNVVLSPHLAGTDYRSMEDMGIEAADCIIKLHGGEWPEGAVINDELRPGWKWR
jgi:D-3-phosphoglycerate dehydrogenase/(S)-sulfolactate dehydrogenase